MTQQTANRQDRRSLQIERVAVNRQRVIDALKKNRDTHRQLFEEALDGYRKRVVQVLDESLARMRNANASNTPIIQLPQPPIQRLDLYDKYIGLFEASSEPTIDLTSADFACLVQDKWNWRQRFLTSLAPYSTTAATAAARIATAGSI